PKTDSCSRGRRGGARCPRFCVFRKSFAPHAEATPKSQPHPTIRLRDATSRGYLVLQNFGSPVVEVVLFAAQFIGRSAISRWIGIDIGAAPLGLVLGQRLTHFEELGFEFLRQVLPGGKSGVRLDGPHHLGNECSEAGSQAYDISY